MTSEEAGVLRLDDFKCHEDDFALVESIKNEAKYEGRRLVTSVQVPGNIHRKEFRDFWKNVLKPTAFIMETIEKGYSLPFGRFHQNAMREIISRLLMTGSSCVRK